MTSKGRLQSELQAVVEAAARARREVDSGQVVDLGSLELLVNRLGAASPDLSSEESEELRKAVLLVVAELGELRDLVRSEHEALRSELEGTGARHSAVAAYGQLPNRRR